jgi:hypothetical protein
MLDQEDLVDQIMESIEDAGYDIDDEILLSIEKLAKKVVNLQRDDDNDESDEFDDQIELHGDMNDFTENEE